MIALDEADSPTVRQARQQVGAQVRRAGREDGALGDNLGEGGSECARTRDVWRARADRALVATTGAVGRHGNAAPYDKDTGAGGCADLVTTHAHEIKAKL